MSARLIARLASRSSILAESSLAFGQPVVGVTAFLALLIGQARGQEERPLPTVMTGPAVISADEVQEIETDLAELPKLEPWAEGDPISETNPRRHYDREGRVQRVPQPAPRADVLLGFQARAEAVADIRALDPPLLSFAGQGFTGVNPPDTTGDVGKDHYIQAINAGDGTRYTVYKKSDGSVAAGPFRLSDLGGPGVSGRGDPIVLYDQLAGRWLLSEFASSPVNGLHVYISKTSDPVSGGWHHYRFDTPNFPDYPKYGVWPDAYYVTSNESDGPAVYALQREKMLNGQSAKMQRFLATQLFGFGFQALTPSDVDGPAPPTGAPNYVLRHRDDEVHNFGSNDASQDFLDLYEFHVDWADPTKSTFSGPVGVPVSEFDSDLNGLTAFNCFPQMGSTVRLDPLREVIMFRLQYRNFGAHESIVGSFVTDVSGSDHGGVRWFELRKVPGGSWHVHQEGTFAPDSHHRWMSSVAMNGAGDVALMYNVSSTTMFPSLRYTGRLASDAMGTMPHGEQALIDGTAPNNSFRYGDYAGLSVDPEDDRTFWMTGEYNAASSWTTRIGAFRFETTAAPDVEADAQAPPRDVERRLDELEEKLDEVLEVLQSADR